jgi:hypothetical protein
MREQMQIWFFAGVLFLIYGVIITAEGFWELANPPAHPPVLFNLHPSIWWGGLMAIAGLVYTIRFWPRVKR